MVQLIVGAGFMVQLIVGAGFTVQLSAPSTLYGFFLAL